MMCNIKKVLLLLGVLVAVGVSGCGERQESTTYYFNPAWTKGGEIIHLLGLYTVRKDFIGSQLGTSYTESARTMTAAGGSDTYKFETTNAPPYAMSCSPSRDYVAYLDALQGGLFEKIIVRNISAASPHTGLERFELLFFPFIKSFDWSNDGNKIVYCTSSEVRIRDWNDFTGTTDTLVVAVAELESVSWKYGTQIAFVHTVAGSRITSLIKADGTGRVDLAAGASVARPQISPTNTALIYGLAGGSYCQVDTSAGVPATAEVVAGFKGEAPRISPAGDAIVYGKTGEQSGIYSLNLTTKTETQIK